MSVLIPDDLASLFRTPDAYGAIQERIELYQQPETINNVAPGQISYIRIPKGDLSDFRDSVLEFNATCSATGGTYVRFGQPIAQIINRVRIMANSVLLDDELEFGRIYAWELMAMDNTEWGSALTITDGIGSAAYRNSLAASASVIYSIKLGKVADILNSVVPVGWLGNNQITIECYWQSNPSTVIETDGTAPTYLINNIQFHYANIVPTPTYKKLLNDKFSSGGMQFSFRAFDNYITTYNSSVLGNLYTVLPFKHRKAITIITAWQPTSTIQTTTTNDKYISYSGYTNYASSRFKVNGIFIPSDKIQNTFDLYLHTCDSLDITSYFNSYIANNWVSTNTAFLLGQTIAQNPRSVTEDNRVVQGIDTASGNSNVIFELNLSTALPSMQTAYFYCEYYAICSINSNGNLAVAD
jgi:hypothetical protein